MIKRLFPMAAVIGGAILSMVLTTDAAWAEKRVALIVGNSTYQTVPQLPNPSRDASSVAKMFKDAGFDTVDVQLNVGNLEFKRAIRKFETEADQADIAVVYYAGHGLEIGGTNYLIPVDARLASDRDADDEAIPLERLVSSADGAKRLRLIILDACRDNPFVGTMRRERKMANRAISAGLGKVEPTSTDTLIAYAAKAGSTADDGDGQHSPFTSAVLKNLPVPGLDVRLAFGRVRDEVLKTTNNRQEPFVYGSLGGGNIALVPAPAVPQETSESDIKRDYELVEKLGTLKAWQVFVDNHPKGFFADLARAQIDKLTPPKVQLASLPQDTSPAARESPSKESIEWDKVKDSTDPAALQKFIKRFPDSPLSINAQQRIDVLTKAAQEREDKARAEREAAAKAAEEARIRAEQQKAEIAAAKKREEDERRAKAAAAEQQAKAAEAERKAAEAKQKAEEAERNKEAAEAAALRAASEKQAREAEAERKKAELAAAREATCKTEQGKLDDLVAKGSEGSGLDNLKSFSRTVTCDRLGSQVVAALDKFNAEAAKRAATLPNSPELVRSAQTQLVRVGCMTGKIDGTLNASTKGALGHYLSIEGQPSDNTTVTEALVTELTKHTTRVCPIECKTGETLKGETCVADQKPAAPAAPATASRQKDEDSKPSRHKDDDEDDKQARRKAASRQPEREQPRAKPAPAPEAPHARQQALARPSIVSGGGGGGGSHTMIGVGF
ncbi:MAG: caspase family protein [Bradyrhizobium sp.]|uniref:caspase family protein n=1 Tax=Bradyrhizobium sp. TaxID=376 RepID=UPI0012152BDB|nr:caspase family protein [Bradyrhizobium sp.]THD59372.1 MAG: caspase family protein [Bradyrhizobium sp.]